MKRIFALFLAVLMLSGCAGNQAAETTQAPTEVTVETTVETTVPETTEPPTEPEPAYYNPLTGEEIEAPLDKKIYAVSINNLRDAIPHYHVGDADMFFETFVNGSIIRGLAFYTDPSGLPGIGSVRSTRYMWNDICEHYDTISVHAGGMEVVLNDLRNRGMQGFNIDTADETYYSYRDKERNRSGYGWEHVLFAKGEGLEAKALEMGFDITQDPEKDYLLRFSQTGSTAAQADTAEVAEDITITILYQGGTKKDTRMVYDAESGKYAYHQYGKQMFDGLTEEPELFKNVIVMIADIGSRNGAQVTEFTTGGEGYFACDGKIIPIRWGCSGDKEPFYYETLDGEPLEMGVGNTYIAITNIGSTVVWGAVDTTENSSNNS